MTFPERFLRVLRRDFDEPRAAWLFTLALVVCAALVIAVDRPELSADRLLRLFPFLLMVAVAEHTPVRLPRGEGRVSVSFSITYAALIAFPPTQAALVAGVAVILSNLVSGKSLNIWLFNGSQLFLSTWVAGHVWGAASLGLGPDILLPAHAIPMALPAIAYFLANTTLVSASIGLAYCLRVTDVWTDNVRWSIPNFLILWALGMLLTVLYRSSAGMAAVLLLWLPLVVMRFSFQQYVELKEAHVATIQSLAAALDAKDPFTRGHSERVAELAARTARQYDMRESEVEAIHYAGLLHDIGKIGIRDAILNKDGPLTDEEFARIKMHPILGADIVKPAAFFEGICEMIRHHHERYDGKGYPDGLQGEAIPLGARILCVVDAFDAMVKERPYRAAFTIERAFAELQAGRGKQFDPQVVDAFLSAMADKVPGPVNSALAAVAHD